MIAGMLSTFVDETTDEYKRRYKLPGGGYLQKRGGQAQSGAVKAYGSWDVAFPLSEYGDQVAASNVDLAYMTAVEFQRHLDTVTVRNLNTVRFEALYALWNNTARTFTDDLWGSLTVQPLANGDSVTYPPVVGTVTEATDDHYRATNYTTISDSNGPIADICDPELEGISDRRPATARLLSFATQPRSRHFRPWPRPSRCRIATSRPAAIPTWYRCCPTSLAASSAPQPRRLDRAVGLDAERLPVRFAWTRRSP